MTQTTHTDNVLIDGSRDITQLQVEGHSTQNQPLQTWQANGATPVAHVAKDGRLQTGSLGLGTPDALVEANLDNVTQASLPKRGVQSLGKLTGALDSAIAWAVHELELLGTGGVSALQTALRAKVTHQNSGSSGSAELRAGDFQAVNQTGTVGTPVGRATGVRGTASNTPLVSGTAYLAKAIGVEATVTNDASGTVTDAAAFEVAPPTNGGTITTLYGVRIPNLTQGQTNYALHTGQGLNRLGDQLNVVGSADRQQLLVKANSTQTTPLAEFQNTSGTPLLRVHNSGLLETAYLTVGNWSAGDAWINLTGSAGLPRQIVYHTAGSPRWTVNADGVAESGANAGSNLNIGRYSDAGAFLGNVLSINRATGQIHVVKLTLTTLYSGGGDANLNVEGPAGTNRQVVLYTAGSPRWTLNATADAETGSNAGSNFFIGRFTDAGGFVDAPLGVNRASGLVSTFQQMINRGVATSAGGALELYETYRPTSGAGSDLAKGVYLEFHDDRRTSNVSNQAIRVIYVRDSTATHGPSAYDSMLVLQPGFQSSLTGPTFVMLGVEGAEVAASKTVDQIRGIYINNGRGDGTIGTQIGLYIEDLTKGSANYAIHTGAGLVRFGGAVLIDGAASVNRSLYWRTGSSPRWEMICSSGTESGGNVSSDFALGRYSDAGVFIDVPLVIRRSDGVTTLHTGDAGTTTVTDVLLSRHNSSATPGTGYGSAFLVYGKSSTTLDREMGRLRWLWTTATDASRAAEGALTAHDSAGERIPIRWGANGSASTLGFHGTTPVTRTTYGAPTGTATRTVFDTSTVTLAQLAERVKAMVDDLRSVGLFA
jgi:hypothetical protein